MGKRCDNGAGQVKIKLCDNGTGQVKKKLSLSVDGQGWETGVTMWWPGKNKTTCQWGWPEKEKRCDNGEDQVKLK
jgi:hypothetical protein